MGGIEALSSLVGQFPEHFPAAIFIVQHTSATSPGLLGEILGSRGRLPAVIAEHGMAVQRGRIHVAPPDRHLLLTADGVRVAFGARENHSRPAIDPLFRTAAVHYRSRVIGVILTGLLNDGAAGLLAVKRCGGTAVVQAPEDAAHPEMPRAALAAVEVDHQVALVEMGALLGRLATEPAPAPRPVPEDLLIEVRLTERAMRNEDWSEMPGHSTPYTCPECGGALQEVGAEPVRRYRCQVGHAFTGEVLLKDKGQAVEEALWTALRTLQERVRMLEAMARNEARQGRSYAAGGYEERARETRAHAEQIRDLVARLS